MVILGYGLAQSLEGLEGDLPIPPYPKPGNVRRGRIVFAEDSSQEFIDNFDKARAFLAEHDPKNSLEELINNKKNLEYGDVVLKEYEGYNGYFQPYKTSDGKTHRGAIFWNPKMALKSDVSGEPGLTPAQVLNHEAAHGNDWLVDRILFEHEQVTATDGVAKNLDNLEEGRAMGRESVTNAKIKAKGLGGTRLFHRGEGYLTDSPISNIDISKFKIISIQDAVVKPFPILDPKKYKKN